MIEIRREKEREGTCHVHDGSDDRSHAPGGGMARSSMGRLLHLIDGVGGN